MWDANVQGGVCDLHWRLSQLTESRKLHFTGGQKEKQRYEGLYFPSFNSTKLVASKRTFRLNFLLFWLLIADSTNCLVQVHSYRNQRESEYVSFNKEPFSSCLKSFIPLMWKLEVFVIYSKLIVEAAALVKPSRWRSDFSARPRVKVVRL